MDFKELINQLSKVNEELREHGIRFRQFYVAYPKMVSFIPNNNQIHGLLPAKLHRTEDGKTIDGLAIRGLPTPELQVPDFYYLSLLGNISYTRN